MHDAIDAVGQTGARVDRYAENHARVVGIAVGVVLPAGGRQRNVESRAQIEAQLRAGVDAVVIPHAAFLVVNILDQRIAEGVAGSDAKRHRFAERHVRKPLETAIRVVADGGARAPVEARRVGLAGDDVRQAAEGIAAEQRALRSAQQLHALDVEPTRQSLSVPGPIQPVDVDRHGDIVRARRPGPADDNGRVGTDVSHLQSRNDLVQVEDVGHLQLVDQLAVDDGHGHRQILHARLALGRRNNDLLDDVPVRALGCPCGRRQNRPDGRGERGDLERRFPSFGSLHR